ncbi:MAG: hypothetical protein C0601_00460 [Candidatus Muiribacterium halophilum]|uniref:Anti-sigma factor antagonist n=1 Tax=Muiribacterium halophilum TaxID=2053465 RepID=A0A2N5ZMR9_MUIH1|nr:MAG: hypothetical protein C0601_00460 [Candidatus Muirbacterium halophilum]
MDIKIVENKKDYEIIFHIDGDITINNSDELLNKLSEFSGEDFDIILDFTNLKYIDSAGMGALVRKLKEILSVGGELKIINTPPKILRLFKLTKLDTFFEIS